MTQEYNYQSPNVELGRKIMFGLIAFLLFCLLGIIGGIAYIVEAII